MTGYEAGEDARLFSGCKTLPSKNLRGGILELGHGNDVVSVHSPDYYNTANSFCKGAFCLFLYKLIGLHQAVHKQHLLDVLCNFLLHAAFVRSNLLTQAVDAFEAPLRADKAEEIDLDGLAV